MRTNALFDLASSNFTADLALEGALGNTYAYANRDRICSDAIPALSWAIGSHSVSRLKPQNGDNLNFDMMNFQNGWPAQRLASGERNNNWYHSDFKEVAYTFTYALFKKWVDLGNLK